MCILRDAEERLRRYLRARCVPLLSLNAAVLKFVVSLAERNTLGMVHVQVRVVEPLLPIMHHIGGLVGLGLWVVGL